MPTGCAAGSWSAIMVAGVAPVRGVLVLVGDRLSLWRAVLRCPLRFRLGPDCRRDPFDSPIQFFVVGLELNR